MCSLILTLLLVGLLSACAGPTYYLQAVSGQWKLLHARQDVDTLLSDPSTSPELALRLKNAQRILAFAQTRLDLPASKSYSSYVDTGSDTLVWNVIATAEFSLEPKLWCFPVAGCVPYRGYFKQRAAEKFATKLHRRGMDVIVSPSPAYSSLGWFKDPLLNTMLTGSDVRLAAYLIHELAHQRLYVKGDAIFNESYASFVEDVGVSAWLQSLQRQDELQKRKNMQTAAREFSLLIRSVRSRLAAVYISDAADTVKRQQKSIIFNTLERDREQLLSARWGGRKYFSDWTETPLNNARLVLYNTYASRRCVFRRLFGQAGGDMRKFHALARQWAKRTKTERRKWLDQTCTANAISNATMTRLIPSKPGADL